MKSTLLFILIFLLVCSGFSATFKLKDGTTVSGDVISSNETSVMVEDGKGNVKVLTSDVLAVPLANPYRKEMFLTPFPENYCYNTIGLTGLIGGMSLFHSAYLYTGATLGYERAITTAMTIGGTLSAIYYPTRTTGTFGTMIELDIAYHPLTTRGFDLLRTGTNSSGPYIGLDPYVGFGFGPLIVWQDINRSVWDLPVTIGFNFWFSRDWAVRIQNKFYMMSITAGCRDDASVGAVCSF